MNDQERIERLEDEVATLKRQIMTLQGLVYTVTALQSPWVANLVQWAVRLLGEEATYKAAMARTGRALEGKLDTPPKLP